MFSHFSRVWLFGTPWTVARQAPLSMWFSRQESWSGLPCLPPGNLPDPGIKSESPALQANSLPLSHQANSRNRVGSQTQVCWTSLLQCSRDFWYIFNGLGGESKDGMGLNRWMVLLFKQQIGTEHWVLFSSPVMILSFGSRGFTCPYFCLRVFEVILTPHPFF